MKQIATGSEVEIAGRERAERASLYHNPQRLQNDLDMIQDLQSEIQ